MQLVSTLRCDTARTFHWIENEINLVYLHYWFCCILLVCCQSLSGRLQKKFDIISESNILIVLCQSHFDKHMYKYKYSKHELSLK